MIKCRGQASIDAEVRLSGYGVKPAIQFLTQHCYILMPNNTLCPVHVETRKTQVKTTFKNRR